MTKTPSALKWLAEKRARLANDATQTSKMADELTARARKLQSQLLALDETIRLYDEAIDPTAISSVNGWQGRYGKRGGQRRALLDIFERFAPNWVASDNIERTLIAQFGIDFETPGHRSHWRDRCLGCALRRLLADGLIERQHDPDAPTGKHGYWRLKAPCSPLRLADL